MSTEPSEIRPVRPPWRTPRSWILLIAGIVAAGISITVLLDTTLGLASVDALFTGISRTTGLSVGTAIIGASIVMVIVSWILGLKPGIGTIVTFFGVGILVDTFTALMDAAGWTVDHSGWPLRLVVWFLAAVLLAFAGSCLYASHLGASPYDQLVKSMGRFGLSIPVARVILDGAALLAAWLLGGAVGLGSVGLLLLIPLTFRFSLPLVARLNPEHQ